jgi:N utilization substance protein A
MTARIQLGWVDPADLVTQDAEEGDETEEAEA